MPLRAEAPPATAAPTAPVTDPVGKTGRQGS
jgi:hypothetical protein